MASELIGDRCCALGLPADEWRERDPADGMNTGGEGRDRPAASPSSGHKRKGGGAINLDDDLPGAISQTETEIFPTPPDLAVNSLSIADVKTALRVEVQGFLGELRGVMGGMEKRITESMETKMAGLHTRLDDVQEQAKKHGEALTSLEARVFQLENGGGPSTTATGTASTSGSNTRRRAIVLGGYDRDTPRDTLLAELSSQVAKLQLDFDPSTMFATGIRRGTAIVPMHPKEGESEKDTSERFAKVLRQIREADIEVGVREDGKPRLLWAAWSKTQEQRQRSAYAGKVKRLLLTLDKEAQVECEWSSGTVWLGGTRVASATTAGPLAKETHTTKFGWLDVQKIAEKLGKEKKEIEDPWGDLEAQLR